MSDGSDMDIVTAEETVAPKKRLPSGTGRRKGDEQGKIDASIIKAEDLIENDDLLCAIFVDTLGQKRTSRLGVRYQQSDFVCPLIDTRAVLSIVVETVARGDLALAMNRIAEEVPAIKAHLATKDLVARKRFNTHLMRYLRLYLPTTRVEIQMTERYKWHTGYAELAVYATQDISPTSDKDWRGFQKLLNDADDRLVEMGKFDAGNAHDPKRKRRAAGPSANLALPSTSSNAAGVVMIDELKGAMEVVPKVWKISLDVAQDMEEASSNGSVRAGRVDSRGMDRDEDSELKGTQTLSEATGTNSKGVKFVIRDHSLVQTASKGLVFLLGPGRFMNHDCDPHVVLHSTGASSLSFKVLRPIRVGDEITTFYGRHYFGRWNTDCLCSTCEKKGAGGFAAREGTTTSPDVASEDTSESQTADYKRVNGSDTEVSAEIPAAGRSSSEGSGSNLSGAGKIPETREHTPSTQGTGPFVGVSPVALARLENADLVTTYVNDLGERRRSNAVAGGSAVTMFATPKRPRTARSDWDTSSLGRGSETPSRTPRRAALAGREMTATMYQSPFGKVRSRARGHRGSTDGDIVGEKEDLPDPPGTQRCEHCLTVVTEPVALRGGGSCWMCSRCQRHFRIYRLPWPARDGGQLTDGPPAHLRPTWWTRPATSVFERANPNMKAKLRRAETPLADAARSEPTGPPAESPNSKTRRLVDQAAEAQRIFQAALEEAAVLRIAHNAGFETSRTAYRAGSTDKVQKGNGMWRRWEYVDEVRSDFTTQWNPPRETDEDGVPVRMTRRGPIPILDKAGRHSAGPSSRSSSVTAPDPPRKILIRIPAREGASSVSPRYDASFERAGAPGENPEDVKVARDSLGEALRVERPEVKSSRRARAAPKGNEVAKAVPQPDNCRDSLPNGQNLDAAAQDPEDEVMGRVVQGPTPRALPILESPADPAAEQLEGHGEPDVFVTKSTPPAVEVDEDRASRIVSSPRSARRSPTAAGLHIKPISPAGGTPRTTRMINASEIIDLVESSDDDDEDQDDEDLLAQGLEFDGDTFYIRTTAAAGSGSNESVPTERPMPRRESTDWAAFGTVPARSSSFASRTGLDASRQTSEMDGRPSRSPVLATGSSSQATALASSAKTPLDSKSSGQTAALTVPLDLITLSSGSDDSEAEVLQPSSASRGKRQGILELDQLMLKSSPPETKRATDTSGPSPQKKRRTSPAIPPYRSSPTKHRSAAGGEIQEVYEIVSSDSDESATGSRVLPKSPAPRPRTTDPKRKASEQPRPQWGAGLDGISSRTSLFSQIEPKMPHERAKSTDSSERQEDDVPSTWAQIQKRFAIDKRIVSA